MEIKDLAFEQTVIVGAKESPISTKYRSTNAYYKSIRFFCVKWPKEQRTKTAKIGVSRNSAWTEGCKDYPDDERGRTWYWNLGTRQLEDSKHGPPYKPYPVGEGIDDDLDIPELFWMILDMDRGTLSFAMAGKKDLGVAFDDLNGNMLYVTYEEDWVDDAGQEPAEMNRALGSR